MLLDKQADVNIKTERGFTPLDIASYLGHGEIFDFLRQHGAMYG